MARIIDISKLSGETLTKFSKELTLEKPENKYGCNTKPESIPIYELENNTLYTPFAYAKEYSRTARSSLAEMKVIFEQELREHQKILKKEAMEVLNRTGSVIISAYTGFGKTVTATSISCSIGLRTLIVVNRVILMKQWREEILTFCSKARVVLLDPKTTKKGILPVADFYVINATNLPKVSQTVLSKIGTVIVDECHQVMAERLCKGVLKTAPRYLIGLSATPYRTDGLNGILDLFFGTEKIYRKLHKKHTVYYIKTGIKPVTTKNIQGNTDWNSLLESLGNNKERNERIIKLIQAFTDRTFLVLCKRVDQAEYLYTRLLEEKEDVTSLIGKNQTFEKSSRILVGSIQKTGTGFNHPRLDTLLLATDVESYYIQYLGRVFRREDVTPVIFDFVDDHHSVARHFKTRCGVYEEHGGEVLDFNEEYPEFW